MSTNDGKYLEGKIKDALTQHQGEHPSYFLRLYDAHAANSFLPAQPGDFIWTIPHAAALIECKSTEESAPLKDLLDSRQIAKHRLWHRSGHPSLFVYADLLTHVVAWFDGRVVVDHFLRKGKLVAAWEGGFKTLSESLNHLYTYYSRETI